MLRTKHWLAILAILACGCTQSATPPAAKTNPGTAGQSATSDQGANVDAGEAAGETGREDVASTGDSPTDDAESLAAAQEEVKELFANAESFPFEFTLPDLDDKPVSLADYKGKVVIVDIWGTWCPPCRMEIPHFIDLKKRYAEKGFDIVGINYEGSEGDEAKQKIAEFVKENGINYTCVIGDEATQGQVPKLEGYPTTLFIDRTGTVRLKVVGYHKLAVLDAIVNELLPEEAPAEKANGEGASDDAKSPEPNDAKPDDAKPDDAGKEGESESDAKEENGDE